MSRRKGGRAARATPRAGRKGAAVAPEQVAAALPAGLGDQIDRIRGNGVVVVQQSTFPAVTAPLGWVLSQQSMETMDRALGQQAMPGSAYEGSRPPSITDYQTLAAAIAMTRTGP